jgi:hypothetical protein
MRNIGAGFVVTLAVGLSTRPAAAQSTPAAEALFDEGRRAMESKDYERACQRFRESNRLDPAVGTLLNLAVCETARAHLATGWELFKSVAEKLGPEDPRRKYVTSELAQIEPRLPKLVFQLAPGAPQDTRVKEGATEFSGAAFGVPLPLDPGAHHFAVDAPGYAAHVVEVELTEGATTTLEIAPGDPVVPSAQPAIATVPTSSGAAPTSSGPPSDAQPSLPFPDRRLYGWIAGGVGIAGVGIGLTTGILALGKKSTVDDGCNDRTRVCSAEAHDAASEGRTLAVVSTVSWVVGVVGLGTGAYFILTSNPKSGTRTSMAPDVLPGGGGLRVNTVW